MPVSPALRARWRSGKHVGPAKPNVVVKIQRGLIDRHFAPFVMLDGSVESFGEISGGKFNDKPWHGYWRATGDWIELPNVQQVDLNRSFTNNGVTAATIHMDNIIFKQITGAAGIFHLISRGYLAPWYGYINAQQRPKVADQNEWFDVLNGGYRVKVWQGYGDALEPTWCGLIDDTDVVSHPDSITMTCRDFGAMATDLTAFGWNKARDIRSPIVFADRDRAMNHKKVGGGASSSSHSSGHTAGNVAKKGSSSYWETGGSSVANNTEWIQVLLPKGTYESIYIDSKYAGVEAWVALSVTHRGMTGPALKDGEPIADGWIDVGAGNVPGDDGGFPFVKYIQSLPSGGQTIELGFKLVCGDNTVLRVAVSNLQYRSASHDYRAAVSALSANQTGGASKESKIHHWILVDDAADVVKWCLMWCGFHEWEVEPTGVRLKDPMVFHQATFFIDIINHIKEQGDFVFHIARPSDHPDSIGVPIFRRTRALKPPQSGAEEIRDTDLLTGLQTKFAKESLAWLIHVRGKEAPTADGGVRMAEDPTLRITAHYFPPWSGAHHNVVTGEYDHQDAAFADRLSGLWKQLAHTDQLIETEDEAMMGAILIAALEGLTAFTGTVTVPGYPGFELDEQVGIMDMGSGVNTRMWVASHTSSFIVGEAGSWVSTLSGSMLDTPDLVFIATDYYAFLTKVLESYK